jgi:hypothetical protein
VSLIDNERTKLLANALDRASTACFTVGILTPTAGYLYGMLNFTAVADAVWLLVTAGGWLFATVALHSLARTVLKRLKP